MHRSCFRIHLRLRLHRRAARARAGFTVIELTVSLLVLLVVMLGMLSLFDFANRLAGVQTNVADMQQSLRVAQQDAMRAIRMAGRGPIPLAQPPAGIAVAVWDQVPAGTRIGADGTPLVVPGTDILTVRGVFSSVYQVNAANDDSFDLDPLPGGGFEGTVIVDDRTPSSIPQDLKALEDAVAAAQEDGTRPRERLVLVTPQNAEIWLIAALDPNGSDVTATQATLKFTAVPAENPVYFDMPSLSPTITDLAKDVTSVAYVGILEEHRFYIRELFDVGPNRALDAAHRFSRARVFPGTDLPWRGRGDDAAVDDQDHPSWSMDVADNMMDLQVALAFDSPRGGGSMGDDGDDVGDDDRIFESADGNNDDWLFNDSQPVDPAQWTGQQLCFIRLTTLARTDRRDSWYRSPVLVRLENHDLAASQLNNRTDRMFRYRPLETLIDMRNL